MRSSVRRPKHVLTSKATPSTTKSKKFRVGDRLSAVVEDQINEMYELQKLFETKLASLRKYEEYLERVRTTYNDQFPEIVDILNRYTTLKKSNTDLIR